MSKVFICYCGRKLEYSFGKYMCFRCGNTYDNNGNILVGKGAGKFITEPDTLDSKKSENLTSNSPHLISCSACHKEISNQAVSCPHCGQPTGVHVCPKCGSTDTEVISGADKAVSLFLWGGFAANKVVSKFACNKCGHKF